VLAAAHAIHEIANSAMASAIRMVTVQRGIDPRTFTLVAFGGAGPVHAAALSDTFGSRALWCPGPPAWPPPSAWSPPTWW